MTLLSLLMVLFGGFALTVVLITVVVLVARTAQPTPRDRRDYTRSDDWTAR